MSDILTRDVPDQVLAAIDARTARLGISRSEYVRRRLAQDGLSATGSVTVERDRRATAQLEHSFRRPGVTTASCRRPGSDGLVDRQIGAGPARR
jgi:hypothetical protein